MKKTFTLLLALFFVLSSFRNEPDSTLDPITDGLALRKADQLFAQIDFSSAYEAYHSIWTNSSSDSEIRAEAGRVLAKWHGLYLNEMHLADEYLRQLLDYPGLSESYLLKSRLHLAQAQFDTALVYAELSIQEGDLDDKALTHYAQVVLESNLARIRNEEKLQVHQIEQAIERMNSYAFLTSEHYRILLGLSLLADEGLGVEKSWLGYFRLDRGAKYTEILSSCYSSLSKVCNAAQPWSEDQQIQLVKALAKSGFVEWAAAWGKSRIGDHPDIQDIFALADGYLQIKSITLNHYRNTVRGQANSRKFKRELEEVGASVYEKLQWSETPPKYSLDRLEEELGKRFHWVLRIYENRFTGLHLGHAIQDTVVQVLQYDQSAELRFVKVDNMVSNGFESWFWDGKLSHSGWINQGKEVFQVRLFQLAENEWAKIQNTESQIARQQYIDHKKQSDLELSHNDPYAYLSGIHSEIRYKALMKMFVSISGNNEEENKQRFLNHFNAKMEAGILIHEGRHALDKRIKNKWNDSEFEFRAKLSEIIYSTDPFFALGYGGILSPDMGGKGAHGQANLRIVQGLVGWMKANSSEIEGYTDTLPYLYQLPLLSDDQLRSAFASMDTFP